MISIGGSLKVFSLFIFLFASLTIAAKEIPRDKIRKERAVENLKTGVKSKNDGLKRDCIYFAGKYKIASLAPTLIEQFREEPSAQTRILLALSLYQIGDAECILKLKELSVNEDVPRVKRICNAVCLEYLYKKNSDTIEVAKAKR